MVGNAWSARCSVSLRSGLRGRTRGKMICPENGTAMKGFTTVFRSCYGRSVRCTSALYVDDWFGAVIIRLSIFMPPYSGYLKMEGEGRPLP